MPLIELWNRSGPLDACRVWNAEETVIVQLLRDGSSCGRRSRATLAVDIRRRPICILEVWEVWGEMSPSRSRRNWLLPRRLPEPVLAVRALYNGNCSREAPL